SLEVAATIAAPSVVSSLILRRARSRYGSHVRLPGRRGILWHRSLSICPDRGLLPGSASTAGGGYPAGGEVGTRELERLGEVGLPVGAATRTPGGEIGRASCRGRRGKAGGVVRG